MWDLINTTNLKTNASGFTQDNLYAANRQDVQNMLFGCTIVYKVENTSFIVNMAFLNMVTLKKSYTCTTVEIEFTNAFAIIIANVLRVAVRVRSLHHTYVRVNFVWNNMVFNKYINGLVNGLFN